MDNREKPKQLFGRLLKRLCEDTNLWISDERRIGANPYTFISEKHGTRSWLVHIVATTNGDAMVLSVEIKYDFISSDQLPIVSKPSHHISSGTHYQIVSLLNVSHIAAIERLYEEITDALKNSSLHIEAKT